MEESKQTKLDIVTEKPVYWIWEKKLPKQLCELLIQESKNFELKNQGLINTTNGKIDKKIRDSNISWAPPNHWIEGILLTHAFYANESANWHYNITHSKSVQIGEYTDNGHYDWHQDWDPFNNIHSNIRKISMVCLLNDRSEFEGGEFAIKLMDDEKIINLEQGTIIAFPSFLTHKVYPVTKGTRISAVSWIVGDRTF